MRTLLDTHVLLWWLTDDRRLSATARALLENPQADVCVSAATSWEVATKERIGRLGSVERASERLDALVQANGFRWLAIDHRHARHAGELAPTHRDPFDRMLAAQCALESLTLVTRDPAFDELEVDTIW